MNKINIDPEDKELAKDVLQITGIFIVFVLIIITPITFALYELDKKACKQKFESFEAVQFSALNGCLVKVNDIWVPQSNLIINVIQ